MLEGFDPSEAVTFEDACPQMVRVVTGEVQNQEKTSATFLQLKDPAQAQGDCGVEGGSTVVAPSHPPVNTLPAQPHQEKQICAVMVRHAPCSSMPKPAVGWDVLDGL